MPIYEYECGACYERFEKLVRMSTRPEQVECPACGEHEARQLVSLTASVGRGGQVAAQACAPTGG